MTERLHEDELVIDLSLVRGLVDRQLPQYASLDLLPLAAAGSSNRLFRLGPELLVRLPRQPGGSATIEKEARWLPRIAHALPVAVPEVVALGEPDETYPERWSVTTWLAGTSPTVVRPGDVAPSGPRLTRDLVALVEQLGALSVPAEAADDPALRWYRGEPLRAVDDDFREALDACRRIEGLDLDLDAAGRVWELALAADRDHIPALRWYHGDLLAENLLVRGDRLGGVLDFGGLSVGDPAVDLAPSWEILDSDGRELFRQALGADDQTWLRGAGWALLLAVLSFPYYWRTMPGRCADRLALATNVLSEL